MLFRNSSPCFKVNRVTSENKDSFRVVSLCTSLVTTSYAQHEKIALFYYHVVFLKITR